MKFLLTGDWHITDKRPENRTDNYLESALAKVAFIMKTARNNNVLAILQPGDLTDSPSISYDCFTSLMMEINRQGGFFIYTTFGQHDLRYRTASNTALRAMMESCQKVLILREGVSVNSFENVVIQAAAYGEDIPAIIPDKFNILITHRMIIKEKLWEGQKEYDTANNFLRRHRYDLIVSGDNHQSFSVETPKRSLFNCGALLRSSVAQLEHQPYVVLYDTETRVGEKIMIPVQPAEKVFQVEKILEKKERDEKVDAFVEGLSENKDMGLSFEDSLKSYIEENAVDKKVVSIIDWAKR